MNVYDFDNTIYSGESVVDFYFFLLKKDISLIKILPKMLQMIVRYKKCLLTVEEMISVASRYSKEMIGQLNNLDCLISEFWDINEHKIKPFYLKNKKEDDLILSAGCDFLLEEICRRIGVKLFISSTVDRETGEVGELCFHKNKVDIFKRAFPDTVIDEFYTDSMNDEPMFQLSKRVFLVKGNSVKEVQK